MNHTHYRAMCPRCGHPNVMEKPATNRKTLDFQCTEHGCSTEYRVKVEQIEPYTPEQRGKVKPYMNRQERDVFLVMLNMADNVTEFADKVPGLPEVSRFAYKQAQNWLAYGAYEWIQGKDIKTAAQLRREADVYTLGLLPKRDAKTIAAKNARADAEMRNEIIMQDREPILDLSLATMQFCCRQCDGSPAAAGCPVKDALEKLAIPSYDAVPECPYAYSGLSEDEISVRRAAECRTTDAVLSAV